MLLVLHVEWKLLFSKCSNQNKDHFSYRTLITGQFVHACMHVVQKRALEHVIWSIHHVRLLNIDWSNAPTIFIRSALPWRPILIFPIPILYIHLFLNLIYYYICDTFREKNNFSLTSAINTLCISNGSYYMASYFRMSFYELLY